MEATVVDADVIVLSDSDEDVEQNVTLPVAGISVMISDERPLDLGLFIPSTSGCDSAGNLATNCSPITGEILNSISGDEKMATENAESLEESQAAKSTGQDISSIRCPLKASFCNLFSSSCQQDLTSCVCESYDPNASALDEIKINNNFKCTVRKCNAILSNNISLMFHLWSHLVNFQSFGLESPISELEKMSMCPQCLNVFPTPNRLQKHYIDVHGQSVSSSTCLICEIVVDKERHLIHDGLDAPYFCNRCRYRTSVRTLFLDHFVRFHSSTATLLCPFCLLVLNVRCVRKQALLTSRQYTDHIFSHLKGKLFKCDQCALRFLSKAEKLNHKEDHMKMSSRWNKKVYAKKPRRLGIRLLPEEERVCCFECYERPSNLKQHWKRNYACASCKYTTNCRNAFFHHKCVGCIRQRCGITRKRIMEGCFSATSFLYHPGTNEIHLKATDIFNGFSKSEEERKKEEKLNECEEKQEEEEANIFGVIKKPSSALARYTSQLGRYDQFPKLLEKPCNDSSVLIYAKRQFISAITNDHETHSLLGLLHDNSL